MPPPTTPAWQRGLKQATPQFATADLAQNRNKSEAAASPRNASYSWQHGVSTIHRYATWEQYTHKQKCYQNVLSLKRNNALNMKNVTQQK